MRYLKKFEIFDFKSLPTTTVNYLTNYYSCDDCNNIWKMFNKTSEICKFCSSENIEEVSEEEWYEIAKSRLNEDEYKRLIKDKDKESEEFVDLLTIKKINPYGN